MVRLPDIHPDQRVTFVGRTGAGKTYLARSLLSNVDRLFVLDAKGTLNVPDWNLEPYDETTDEEIGNPDFTFRYRIPAPLDGDWEPYLWQAYYARNCTVYIDEVYGVESGTKPSKAMQACITRGRELGVGVWCSTQRPSYIPLIILSEADWIFEFQLRIEEDKKRIASMIGRMAMKQLHGHEVIVFNDAMDKPIFFRQAKVRKARARGKRAENVSDLQAYRESKVS